MGREMSNDCVDDESKVQFEEWCEKQGMSTDIVYASSDTQISWVAWQASRSHCVVMPEIYGSRGFGADLNQVNIDSAYNRGVEDSMRAVTDAGFKYKWPHEL